MSDALPLPPRPNLEQYKKLAKDLQSACKSGDPAAIRQWAARIATRRQAESIARRWNHLREANENAVRCTLAAAQFFLAREHGFANWPTFARHVQELARAQSPVSNFEAAVNAIVTGDAHLLRKLLAEHPGLPHERSTRDHRSTLLHYVSANGVEDYRQKTPQNIVEIANLLLDAGAEVDAESDAYGGECTTLGLVATSVHPERDGVQIALLQTLLDHGAAFLQPGIAGNRHSIVHGCIANGQPEAARFFADLGAPLDLESAAAIGRLDALRAAFPAADPRQLESAFRYACGYGSLAVVEFLLDRGVDPSAGNRDGQTALHWATWAPHLDVIELLLERGAPADAKALDMVLSTWNNTAKEEKRERCYQAVALLARAGAKLDRERSVIMEKIDSDPRMLAALRGEMPIL